MSKWTAAILAGILSLSYAVAAQAGGGKECAEKQAAVEQHVAKMKAHGWLGIETDKNAYGSWVVKSVAENSPAAEAGFQAGDVLLAFNGIALTEGNMEAVKKAKAANAPGKQVRYTVRRGGAERQLTATLAPVPEEVLAKARQEAEVAQNR